MPSIAAILQTAWFIDPQNVSTTAADTNDGRTAATALRSPDEFFRRVGTPLLLQDLQEVTITFLSSLREGDRFQLEVIGHAAREVGPSGRVIINGTYTPETSGTITGLTAADQPTNVIANVELSFAGVPSDIADMMLFVTDKGFLPYALDQSGIAGDVTFLDRAYNTDGVWNQMAQADALFRFVPVDLGDVGFLKADASSGAQIEVNGVAIGGLAEASGVTFRGCLIDSSRQVSDCTFLGCTLGPSGNPCMMQFNNVLEGCYIGNVIAQAGGRLVAGLIGRLIVDPQGWVRLAGVAANVDTVIEVYQGGKVLAGEVNALFGQNGLIRLSSDASVVREALGSITIPVDPAIEWPDAAPLSEVYDLDTLLPTGVPASPADGSWATYDGGVSGGNWIHWRTGARVIKE